MRETTKRVSEDGSLSRLRPTSHGASSEERAARFRQPLAAGRRAHDAGFGVGRGVEAGLGAIATRGVGVLARLDAHHPRAGRGLRVKIDRAELLDADFGERGDHRRIARVTRFVGADLADHPPLLECEEPAERVAQARMRVERVACLRERRARLGEVEEVARDDQEAGTVPGVQGSRRIRR